MAVKTNINMAKIKKKADKVQKEWERKEIQKEYLFHARVPRRKRGSPPTRRNPT